MRRWILLILMAFTGAVLFLRLNSFQGPEDRVAAYLKAIANKDEREALVVWELSSSSLPNARSITLAQRRQAVTEELLASNFPLDFTVLDVQWWDTCCEPHLTQNLSRARLARLRVQLLHESQDQPVYIFDIVKVNRVDWFPASDLMPHRWVVYDVYPVNQDPLAFPWVKGTDNRTYPLP